MYFLSARLSVWGSQSSCLDGGRAKVNFVESSFVKWYKVKEKRQKHFCLYFMYATMIKICIQCSIYFLLAQNWRTQYTQGFRSKRGRMWHKGDFQLRQVHLWISMLTILASWLKTSLFLICLFTVAGILGIISQDFAETLDSTGL